MQASSRIELVRSAVYRWGKVIHASKEEQSVGQEFHKANENTENIVSITIFLTFSLLYSGDDSSASKQLFIPL